MNNFEMQQYYQCLQMTKINEFKSESAHTSLVFQTTLKALCQQSPHTFGTNNYYKYWKDYGVL